MENIERQLKPHPPNRCHYVAVVNTMTNSNMGEERVHLADRLQSLVEGSTRAGP